MANPTIQKTWEFEINNLVEFDGSVGGNANNDRRRLLFNIKEAMVNNGTTTFTSPWTVVSSSDSSTASAADNWTDYTDLVWRDDDGSAVFSWIVLRQTGISTTFELLITCEEDFTSADGSRIGAWVAQAGFTGGTTTARPTATDERQIRDSTSNGRWGSGADGTPNTNYRWHLMMSSDGECTRIIIHMNKIVTGIWMFDVPDNAVTGWSNPYVAVIYGENNQNTNVTSYVRFLDNATMLGRYSGTDTTMFLSSEGIADSAIGEFLKNNQLDNTWIATEMGIASQTSTFTGRMGTMYDLWWGSNFSSSEATGRLYPETGTKLYVQVKDIIFPWDGSSVYQSR